MQNTVVKFPVNKRDTSKPHALILGVNGAIGDALAKQLFATHSVVGVARDIHNASHLITLVQSDYAEHSFSELYHTLNNISESYDLIINCIGTLHGKTLKPEKRLSDLSAMQLSEYFYVNSTLPALLIKHLHSFLPKQQASVYANLSAMIGSIGDNRIGGWYGYRASKAALNMLIKTASIELSRSHPKLALIAMHPGTTKSELSEPFTKNKTPDKLFPPKLTAARLLNVIKNVSHEQTGSFFNWDGSIIEW